MVVKTGHYIMIFFQAEVVLYNEQSSTLLFLSAKLRDFKVASAAVLVDSFPFASRSVKSVSS